MKDTCNRQIHFDKCLNNGYQPLGSSSKLLNYAYSSSMFVLFFRTHVNSQAPVAVTLDLSLRWSLFATSIIDTPGASCSKLTMLLVKDLLKFQMAILQIHYYFVFIKCENPKCIAKDSHIFSTTNKSVFAM